MSRLVLKANWIEITKNRGITPSHCDNLYRIINNLYYFSTSGRYVELHLKDYPILTLGKDWINSSNSSGAIHKDCILKQIDKGPSCTK